MTIAILILLALGWAVLRLSRRQAATPVAETRNSDELTPATTTSHTIHIRYRSQESLRLDVETYHARRNANRSRVAATRDVESINPAAAADAYQLALKEVSAYEAFARGNNLFASNAARSEGDVTILDRLTICLIKLGRNSEAVEVADRYFEEFPYDRVLQVGIAVRKRVSKHRTTDAVN